MSESDEGGVWVDDYVTSTGTHVSGHWRKRGHPGHGGGEDHGVTGQGAGVLDAAPAPSGTHKALSSPAAVNDDDGGGGGARQSRVEAGMQALRRRREATSGATSVGVAFNYAAFVDRNQHRHAQWRQDVAAGRAMDPQLRAAIVERLGQDSEDDEPPAGADSTQVRCPTCGQFLGAQHTCPMPDGLPAGNYADLKGEERTEQMLADLQDSVVAIVQSGQLGRWLDAMASNGLNRWSFNNRMLSVLQVLQRDPDAELHLMGFRQWDKYDRKVRKGEKAVWILAPMTRKLREEDDRGESRERTIVTGFKAVPVFNIDQTDGEPMPASVVAHAPGEATPGTLEGLRDRVGEAGYSYEEAEIPDYRGGNGTLGYTDPQTKKIVVDARLNGAQKASTIAHELGHVHCGHVDGDFSEYLKHRGQMETEAEMTAALVTRSRGASREQAEAFSPGYIAGWSRGKPEVITGAMDRATKAFNTIMDGPWPNDSTKE